MLEMEMAGGLEHVGSDVTNSIRLPLCLLLQGCFFLLQLQLHFINIKWTGTSIFC